MLPVSTPSSRKSQTWIRTFIVLVGGFTLLCFLFADPLLRGFRRRDAQDAPLQTDAAPIVTLVPAPTNAIDDTHVPEPLVSVRFRGGIHTAKKVSDFGALKLNQPARITYRVGKSGQIYVDEVAPLPAAPAHRP